MINIEFYKTKDLKGKEILMYTPYEDIYETLYERYSELKKNVDPTFLFDGVKKLSTNQFMYFALVDHLGSLIQSSDRIQDEVMFVDTIPEIEAKIRKGQEPVIFDLKIRED